MTLVSSVLTQAQIDEIRALRASLPGDQTSPGRWFPVYSKLYEFITDPVSGEPKAGVDHNVWLWLRGARFVNNDEGLFADLIREYTRIQYRLRYGTELDLDDLNEASNDIARGFINEWVPEVEAQQATATVPDIKKTGERDAGPIAARIFSGDYAGWAGTFLFANLGESSFYRDWILKPLAAPLSPPGERTRERGGYDVVSVAQGVQDYQALSGLGNLTWTTFWETIATYGELERYKGVVDAIATEADATFRETYGLGAEDSEVKIGSDTFGYLNVAGARPKSAHYATGTTDDDVIGFTPAANGSYVTSYQGYLLDPDGDVVHAGRGNDVVYGSDGSDVLDGGEGDDTLIYIPALWSSLSTLKVSFDAKSKFDSRIVVDKQDLLGTIFGQSRDIAVEFERLQLDYRSEQPTAGTPSGREERLNTNPDAPIVTVTWSGGSKDGDQLLRSETLTIVGDFTKIDGGPKLTIDAGRTDAAGISNARLADRLDFSGATGRVLIGRASGDPAAVEIFADYSPMLQLGQWLFNLFVPTGEPSGNGLTDPTGLRFTDFEHVIGSSQNDVLGLWRLSPGGALTAEQEAQLAAIKNTPIAITPGNPAAVAAKMDERMEAARAIPQNQQQVIIEAGAGHDVVIGTQTGANMIYGGDGNDHLTAGGFTSQIYGGAGKDFLQGGGFKSQLYGGDGSGPDSETDVFSLANHSFVMDAGTNDRVEWGPFRLTGGVQQWWMEGNWAYWTPFTSLLAGTPLPFANMFGALSVLLDTAMMTTVRYGLTEGNQLVVQMGRGRVQAFIQNYSLNLETGEATGGIVAMKQVIVDPRKATLGDFENYVNLALKAGFGVCFKGTDPLVLDLDGDGLELTRRDERSVYFDLDKDGFAERTAWVKSDDGLLARDINGNGAIDDIGELFGDATTPGFAALAALDSNGDGKISAADAGFASLRVWRDLDQDGVSDAGELKTLAESGIAEISLAAGTPSAATIRGNTIRAEATFTRTDGTTSKIADVILEGNQTDSRYLGDTTVSAEAAALPTLKGYGNVAELRIAMSHDATLLGLVSTFTSQPATTSWVELRNSVDDILYRWAGVDDVAATPIGDGSFDMRKLAFLETYFGYQLTPRDANGQPSTANLSTLVQSWNDVLDKTAVRLAAQGPLSTVLGGSYGASADRLFSGSAATLADSYKAALSQLPADSAAALAAWNAHWAPMLKAYRASLVRHDSHDIRTDFAVQSLVRAVDGLTPALSMVELVSGLGLDGVHLGTDAGEALARSGEGLQVYVGGAGNDTLTGGSGQDVYVYGRSFGQDVIIDNEGAGKDSGDRIRFALFKPEDLTIRRVGIDLVITVKGTGDSITVKGQFEAPVVDMGGIPMSPERGIEEIQFADGTLYEAVDIAAAIGLGTDASETIEGSALNDEIEGLKGDDLLKGGDGGDSYYFSAGDGQDTIHDVMTNPLLSGADTLFLVGGLSAADILLSREGSSKDLKIGLRGSTDSITIKDQFAYNALGYETKVALDNRIDAVFFSEGSAWSWLDLQANVIATYTTSGNDTTYGFGTSDQFHASAGNDKLVGFDGGDTYRFGRGSGQDVIHDQSQFPETFISGLVGYSWGSDDILEFGEGITLADVTFARTGAAPDLTITINGASDSLIIKDQFDGVKLDIFNLLGVAWFDRVEKFKFADGTVLSWEQVLRIVTTGTAGNDNLYGAYYRDTIEGKAGDDFMSGGDDGDTYLFGRGDGHDIIEENQENVLTKTPDTLKFGAGIAVGDVSFRRDGETADLIVTINDTGDSIRIRNQYNVTETGVFGAIAFDQVEQFEWADGTVKTWPTLAQEIIDAAKTPGDDLIVGTHFDDRIDGGAGNDSLKGSDGNDTYVFGLGYGHDIVRDDRTNILSGRQDTVEFGPGISLADVRFSKPAGTLDLVITLPDGSTMTIKKMFDVVFGIGQYEFNRIERFTFADQPALVLSDWDVQNLILTQAKTAGDDVIEGFELDDLLDGGAGNDRLYGGNGNDTYVFGRGYGHDIVEDYEANVLSEMTGDRVLLAADLTPDDVEVLAGAGNDVVLQIRDTGETLTLKNQNHYTTIGYRPYRVERVEFADGTVWDAAALRVKALASQTTDGNDTITGYYTNDLLVGGAGNDILRGGDGSDTYRFAAGFGQDVIEESVHYISYDDDDAIEFAAGIDPSQVTLARVPGTNDLVVAIAGTSDQILVKGQFSVTAFYGGWEDIESIRFADGTRWAAADIRQKVIDAQRTDGDDVITGFDGGDDVMDGGLGNDTLKGGARNDTYLFGRGSGQDVIEESHNVHPFVSNTDKVVFGSGVAVADVTFGRLGSDLGISIAGTTDALTIRGHFTRDVLGYSKRVESFVFADGTVLSARDVDALLAVPAPDGVTHEGTAANDTMTGTTGSDVMAGRAGNDTLSGGAGSDAYLFGASDGADVVTDSPNNAGDLDELRLTNLNPADIELSRAGNDLLVTVAATGEQVRIAGHFAGAYTGIEKIVFADGTAWDRSQIGAEAYVRGTDGADTLVGTAASEVFVGKKGADTLRGGSGSDSYRYQAGDGSDIIDDDAGAAGDADVLELFDVKQGDITVTRVGNDAFIRINTTGETIELDDQLRGTGYGVEQVSFGDGTVWDRARLLAEAVFRGTDGTDIMAGTAGDDGFEAGRGADQINDTSGGNDRYIWRLGQGSDVIDDRGGTADQIDVLLLPDVPQSEVLLSRSGADLLVTMLPTGEVLRFVGQFLTKTNGVEKIVFADGAEIDRPQIFDLSAVKGTASADTITGGAGDDLIEGLAGNDILSGGAGEDRLVGGDGADTLAGDSGNDRLIGGAGDDVLKGGDGADTFYYAIGDGADTLQEQATNNNDDTLEFGAGIALADLRYAFAGASNLDLKVSFAGFAGSVTLQGILVDNDSIDKVVFADGTTISRDDLVQLALDQLGTEGAETIYGSERNETLNGRGGNDILDGRGGDDRLAGGAGNDTLKGGEGNDTFVVGIGEGDDIIQDIATNNNGEVLELGAGITPADLRYAYSGTSNRDLRISFANGSGSVTLQGVLYDNDNIDIVRFADGTIWTQRQLLADAYGKLATDGDNSLFGSDWSDTIDGRGGNDVIDARDGDDTLVGSLGNDTLKGGEGEDTYVIGLGQGDDTIIEIATNNNGDVLEFGSGILPANLIFAYAGAGNRDLRISFTNDLGSVTLQGALYDNDSIDSVRFADGTVLTHKQLLARAYDQLATDAANTLYASNWSDTIDGRGGNDVIDGRDGDDRLTGGLGDDTVKGGEGADTYVYRVGDGHDIVQDVDQYNNNDVLELGAGIAASDFIYAYAGSGNRDLKISFANTAGSVTLQGFFYDNDSIDVIRFSDGSSLTQAQILADFYGKLPTAGANTIYGSDWSDTISAGDSNDTIYGRAGNDTLNGDDGGDTLNGDSGADVLKGGSGNDVINGGDDADRLEGGAGDDVLNGGDQADTFIYNLGDGNDRLYDYGTGGAVDTLEFGAGITSSMIRFATSASDVDDIVLSFDGVAGSVTLDEKSSSDDYGPNAVRFADGTVWSEAQLLANYIAGLSTAAADTIQGSYLGDAIQGGVGDDTLFGRAGNDSFLVGIGDGFDAVDGGAGTDTIKAAANDVAIGLRSLTAVEAVTANGFTGVTVLGSAAADTLNFAAVTLTGIDRIDGGAGNDVITGNTAANTLWGSDGDDRLTGGAGNDTLDGGAGFDTAVFAGTRATYGITTSGGAIHVVADNATTTDGNDGTDTLIAIEQAQFKDQTVSLATPIVLDLDGDGVELVDAKKSKAKFDFDGDGRRDKTGWIGKGDGLLVFDRNGNGKVDNAAELSFVGDKPGAKSDLDGLRAFDSNGDGLFSSLDERFDQFMVWRDNDRDGAVDKREMLSLAAAGVAAIDLAGQATEQDWAWGSNITVNTGGFVRTNGSRGGFADVALVYEGSNSGEASQAVTDLGRKANRLVEAIAAFGGSAAGEIDLRPLYEDQRSRLMLMPRLADRR